MCDDDTDPIDFTIQCDREPVIKEPKVYEFDEKTLNSSTLITILHLSDFHYDPYYAFNSSSKCIESSCCRNSSVVSLKSALQPKQTAQVNEMNFFPHKKTLVATS